MYLYDWAYLTVFLFPYYWESIQDIYPQDSEMMDQMESSCRYF